jgi:hypothetical protein
MFMKKAISLLYEAHSMKKMFLIILAWFFLGGCAGVVQGLNQASNEMRGRADKSGTMDSYDTESMNTILHRSGYNDLTATGGSFQLKWEGDIQFLYFKTQCLITGGGTAQALIKIRNADVSQYEVLDIKRFVR